MGRLHQARGGFTLIELSIVLVIIGLIVGGILVGRDLISAAGVRATVTQLEQYNRAANAFYEKYGYLPGDIPAANAVQFGLSASVAARTTTNGTVWGNGDGVLESYTSAGPSAGAEDYLFWTDLYASKLISNNPYLVGSCSIDVGACALPAKIGQGNEVYVFSGGYSNGFTWFPNNVNYYGISAAVTYIGAGVDTSNPGLTVAQAYAIDSKMDDGLPQSGRVLAAYLNVASNSNGYGADNLGSPVWVNPGGMGVIRYGITTAAIAGSSMSCYDNSSASSGTPGVANAAQHYSVEISNGSNMNCALSFRMQAGDN